jgi:hypothetical protein
MGASGPAAPNARPCQREPSILNGWQAVGCRFLQTHKTCGGSNNRN